MASEVTGLAVSSSGVVGVGRAHHSHLVWVDAKGLLHAQAVLPSLADVAAVNFGIPVHIAQKSLQQFIAGKLVVRGKQGVGLRCALELMDFG